MNLKENTAQVVQTYQATTRQGSGCGCFVTGCAVIVGVCLLMCVGSYFVTMHTSIPLSLLERAIEAEGDVEIEGLRGTINSGFEVDSLTFPPEADVFANDEDEGDAEPLRNELKGLKFKFNGFLDLARKQRLIISEMSVDSAKIYAPWKDDDGSVELPPAVDSEEIATELAEGLEELREELENGNSDELKELRIDLISGKDIEIIDPRTREALRFDQLELKNFQMKAGRVVQLGDLTIQSDQLDLKTQPSKRYADESVAWNLTGQVKPLAMKGLLQPLTFDGDFAITADNKQRLEVSLADDQLKLVNPHQSKRTVLLNGFSPADYFEMNAPLAPSNWNVTLNFQSSKVRVETPVEQPEDESVADEESEIEFDMDDTDAEVEAEVNEVKKRIEKELRKKRSQKHRKRKNKYLRAEQVTIEPGAHFQMGTTKFLIETSEFQFGPGEAMKPLFVEATGQLGNRSVIAKLQMRGAAPFYSIQLQAEGMQTRDVWAQLFFENDFSALTEEQKQSVATSMTARVVGESEPVDF